MVTITFNQASKKVVQLTTEGGAAVAPYTSSRHTNSFFVLGGEGVQRRKLKHDISATTTVTNLLDSVRTHGAELVPATAEYLVNIHPPTLLPDALMAELRQNKAELLSYLRTCSYFRYRLRGGEGGIYRTESRDLEAARADMNRSGSSRASASMRSTVPRLVPEAVAFPAAPLFLSSGSGGASDEPVFPLLVGAPVSFSAIVPSALRGCALVAALLFAFAASWIAACSTCQALDFSAADVATLPAVTVLHGGHRSRRTEFPEHAGQAVPGEADGGGGIVQLVKYEAARQALQAAQSVDEVKGIRDKAEAMRAYAKQAKDFEMANWAAEIRIRAERKLGEMLKARKDAGGMAKRGPDKATGQRSQRETSDTTQKLSDIGISKSMSSRAQAIAAVPEDEFESTTAKARTMRAFHPNYLTWVLVIQCPAGGVVTVRWERRNQQT